MGTPHTAPGIPFPIPLKGMNWLDSLSRMSPEYSPWLLNVELEPGYIRSRGTFREDIDLTSEAADVSPLTLGVYDKDNLFVYLDATSGNHKIYEISTGTATLSHTTGAATATEAYPVKHASALYFLTDATTYSDENRYYNGSWNSWGFTSGGSDVGGKVGGSHKGRLYFFDGQTGYYSELGELTGEVGGQWDVSELFDSADDVAFFTTMSSPSGAIDQQYAVIGNLDGEILVYAGDFPDADDWEQVGKFKIAPVLNYNCSLAYNNDVLIPCAYGLVSTRKLFQHGSDISQRITLGNKFDPYWQVHTRNIFGSSTDRYLSTRASIAYNPVTNKIHVIMRGFTDKDETLDQFQYSVFVYSAYNDGWTVHAADSGTNNSNGNIVYYDGDVYFGSGQYITRYDHDFFNLDTVDNNLVAGEWYAEGAYSDLGSPKKHKHLKGFDALIKTTLTGSQIDAQTAANFGMEISVATSQTYPTGFTGDVSFRNPMFNAGVRGNYLQWRMNGTITGTTGTACEIHAISMVVI